MKTELSEEAALALAIVSALWGLFVSVFFMVCAWRAMRAHESIAGSMRESRGELRGEAPRSPDQA